MQRFDVEQFLMLTMVLATAGAIGVGIYSTRGDDEGVAEEENAAAAMEEVVPEAKAEAKAAAAPVAASTRVAPAAAVAVAPPAAPMPSLDAAPEVLDEVPGPQVEDMSW
jgi:hypothetical protein